MIAALVDPAGLVGRAAGLAGEILDLLAKPDRRPSNTNSPADVALVRCHVSPEPAGPRKNGAGAVGGTADLNPKEREWQPDAGNNPA